MSKSKKTVKVKTRKGVWNYCINVSDDVIICYKKGRLLLKTNLGEARTMDEAMSLILAHANRNYGTISSVDIK